MKVLKINYGIRVPLDKWIGLVFKIGDTMETRIVDALILNYNDAVTTRECAERLQEYSVIHRILIVDNNSSDNSFELLSRLNSDKIEVISTGYNGGYGAGNNFGIRYLKNKYDSTYILLCNPDTIIDEDNIKALEDFLLTHPDYAIVAPFMLNTKEEKQYNTAFRIPKVYEYVASLGVVTNKFRKSFYYPDIQRINDEYIDVGAVSGSLFMMDVKKMIEYGMFDECIFLYCEEVSLGIKLAKSGMKTALLPQRTFIHNHSISINKTFKSDVKKHKQLIKSKLYVIKNYYKVNRFIYGLAFLLSRVSIIEIWLISLLRR